MDEVESHLSAPCTCASLARKYSLPLVEGHVVLRDPAPIHRLFHEGAKIVLQNSANPLTPDWYQVKKVFTKSLDAAVKGIPEPTGGMVETCGTCLAHLHKAWCLERQLAPWCTREGVVTAFQKKWDQFVFLPCDKNTRKIMGCCQHLYLERMASTYVVKNNLNA